MSIRSFMLPLNPLDKFSKDFHGKGTYPCIPETSSRVYGIRWSLWTTGTLFSDTIVGLIQTLRNNYQQRRLFDSFPDYENTVLWNFPYFSWRESRWFHIHRWLRRSFVRDLCLPQTVCTFISKEWLGKTCLGIVLIHAFQWHIIVSDLITFTLNGIMDFFWTPDFSSFNILLPFY